MKKAGFLFSAIFLLISVAATTGCITGDDNNILGSWHTISATDSNGNKINESSYLIDIDISKRELGVTKATVTHNYVYIVPSHDYIVTPAKNGYNLLDSSDSKNNLSLTRANDTLLFHEDDICWVLGKYDEENDMFPYERDIDYKKLDILYP